MKINSVIYKKLLAQAEEAKERGMIVLAESVLDAIGSFPEEESEQYSYAQMREDIVHDMWKIATRVVKYHELTSLDAEKINETLTAYADQVLNELEATLGVDVVVKGPREPKVFGEE